MVIKFDIAKLDEIEKAIVQLDKVQRNLKNKTNKFIRKLLDNGVQIARTKLIALNHIESGKLSNSIDCILYKDKNKGVIFTDCPYAVYVEFGTGIVGQKSPHPMKNSSYYDINHHGEKGWYYMDEDSGRLRWTKGIPHSAFMYDTSKDLRKELVEVAKEIFNKYD